MSSPAVATYSIEDLPTWDAFQQASPQGTVFSTATWMKAAAAARDATLDVYAIAEGESILCAIPVFVKKKYGVAFATAHALTPYNGMLLSASVQKEARIHETLTAILKSITGRVNYLSLSIHPSFHDLRPFMWEGWQMHRLYTYMVDISDESTFRSNFSQSLRRKLRRSEDEGISVVESNDMSLLTEQYSYSYSRHGIAPPIQPSAIRTWAESASNAGARLFVAQDRNKVPLASRMIVQQKPFVYDWIAGSSEAGDSMSANHALIAGIMRTYSYEGYSTFDFRGANTPGVIEFKRSFGGLLIAYTEAVFRGSRLLSLAERISSGITHFRRRL